MRPWTHQQPLTPPRTLAHPMFAHSVEHRERVVLKDVVPRAHVQHRHVDLIEARAQVHLRPERPVARIAYVVCKIRRAVLETLAPIRQRQMFVRVALERRHPDIRIADEAVELGAVLFVKPLAHQRVARHEREISEHPDDLERAAPVRKILEVGDWPGYLAHCPHMRRGARRPDSPHPPPVLPAPPTPPPRPPLP